MAAFISVPRDLSKVKTKVFMNLTKRQLLCFGAGALIGVPLFFVLKSTGNISFAAMGMIVVMMPMFFLAMYEKDGQPLEVVAKHYFRLGRKLEKSSVTVLPAAVILQKCKRAGSAPTNLADLQSGGITTISKSWARK